MGKVRRATFPLDDLQPVRDGIFRWTVRSGPTLRIFKVTLTGCRENFIR
jgi:putative component of toxin-antitoxin plasmid stabilization module